MDATASPELDIVPLGIAQAGQLLGMSAHTLRYYESLGLVDVGRDDLGHRSYDASALRRLEFLRRTRLSGMGMSDLTRYVELVRPGESTIPDRLALMEAHRDAIRTRIHALQSALDATEHKIATYGGVLDGLSTLIDHVKETP